MALMKFHVVIMLLYACMLLYVVLCSYVMLLYACMLLYVILSSYAMKFYVEP